ncbi:hypothetical protein ACH47Z_36245 [Streptomyces sp. NPDC020192]|uniref:hypothetical protein n=1 Tax=Streptomyces sp. NPDC020192 TaxID=3365066 RepID=UPI0037933501
MVRWTWRVAYYSYAALATDRYPPFTLGTAPGYPTRLHIPYPERLPRGPALVKRWLRATPQYFLIAISLFSFRICSWLGGIPALLAEVALVLLILTGPAGVLMVTGRYPQRQFDWIIRFDRWVLQVFAYAFLLTTAYPPLWMERARAAPSPRTRRRGPDALRRAH